MVTILLAFIVVLAFPGVSWGKSPTEFVGEPLTKQQVEFLKRRAEALEEAEALRQAELRLLQDAKFCLSIVENTTDAQKSFDDCKQSLQGPILDFYEKWGKTESDGLRLQVLFQRFKEFKNSKRNKKSP